MLSSKRVRADEPAVGQHTPEGNTKHVVSTPGACQRAPSRSRLTGKGRSGTMKKPPLQRRLQNARAALEGITRNSIRRLARRGGVKRIGGMVYDEMRAALQDFLRHVVADAIVHAEHGRRSTVTLNDTLMALKHRGMTVYGFGNGHFLSTYVQMLRKPLKRESMQQAARRLASKPALQSQHHPPVPEAPGPAPLEPSPPMSQQRQQEIQEALVWHIEDRHRAGSTTMMLLSLLQPRLAQHMGSQRQLPCSMAELRLVLETTEADGNLMQHQEANGDFKVLFFL